MENREVNSPVMCERHKDERKNNKPGVIVHGYNPSYSGD
jgi:hypothetical protein